MKRLLIMGCLLALVSAVYAGPQYRNFTDTQGRTIRGRVIKYDAEKEIVTIERDNRKAAKVPISIFSDEDQEYIKAWEIAKHFHSSRFTISIDRKREQLDKKNLGSTMISPERVHYVVTLENKAPVIMENLTIDYCIFYEQEESMDCEQGTQCGSLSLDSIGVKESKSINTEGVTVYRRQLNAGWIYTGNGKADLDGYVRGVWLKVRMKTANGEEIREISLPDTVMNKKQWTTKTKKVGLN